MKKIILALVPALFLVACTKDLTELNVDPKRPEDVSSGSLFTYAQRQLVTTITSANVNLNIFRLIEQQWQETTYVSESRYNLTNRSIPDNLWDDLYQKVLNNLEASRGYMATDVPDENQRKNEIAILDIMEVYTWHYIITTFGDVPYTEALNINNIFPKYDDALTAYKDLIVRLDKDILALNPNAASIGAADAIYDGDPAKWKKFANSLKLKMALTIADTDGALAKSTAESAITSGVFTLNSDNAKFPFSSITPNTNPVWVDLVQSGRQDFVAASTITTKMNALKDPRLPLFFTLDNTGNYSGGTPGSSSSYLSFSHAAIELTKANFEGNILDYSEIQFLVAEAAERGYSTGTTAKAAYDNAIIASILDWGGTSADAATYLAQTTVAYGTASGNYKEKIGTQKWIALYNRGIDAWLEHRRLDYPILPLPTRAVSGFPTRFTYPVNEQNVNDANRVAAAAAIGGDVVETKLFFDKFEVTE
ncbi:SusD/RagB family nutrient-binding outer membrane lipoprotein [Pedobacter sp. AW31-3R]|uniref:SusD/RagB family nutrient-binding outer membrane lipoprotein n=1 Tax=Pedobacter sp. AW31-3R TaxID=3445781 RepID=UPI003FA0FDFD